MGDLHFEFETNNDITMMSIFGSSKAVSKQSDEVKSLRNEFKDLAQKGLVKVIVNLEKIDFMASDTIGSLISGLYILRKKGGNLAIYKPSAYMKKIFDIVKLQDVINIYDNYDEAVNYLNSRRQH